ncbi:hypothetical protein L873DRAFT_841343 [Choiromyces venosus 120613-1]|uniref:Uncharacterized protein n=1 Tax=Choiromyces venosus 120613-1 TaxID=1336337 RepID=A0A3N4K232_9PEZI|nr:hypothetical protein L873DRAFT_841343 [Choiromyces venosus 120613-1]
MCGSIPITLPHHFYTPIFFYYINLVLLLFMSFSLSLSLSCLVVTLRVVGFTCPESYHTDAHTHRTRPNRLNSQNASRLANSLHVLFLDHYSIPYSLPRTGMS